MLTGIIPLESTARAESDTLQAPAALAEISPAVSAVVMQAMAMSREARPATVIELIDALALQRPHIFGLHTGNKIAAALAAKWPECVGDVILAGQTHSLILDMQTRNAALAPYCEKYFPKYSTRSDGSHLLKAWNITQAAIEGFWWPPELLNADVTQAADLAQAEVRVLDHLHGWKSIAPLYRAIFAFD